MVIKVNQELCTGCGACIDICSDGAIQLLDQRAVIDEAICTGCEACVESCPNEAITIRPTLEPSISIRTLPVAESGPVLVRGQVALPETVAPARGLAPLAGATLAFLGREVAPRLLDVLISALERRLAQPTTTAVAPASTSSRNLTKQNKGQRKQARYRGQQPGIRNLRGRR